MEQTVLMWVAIFTLALTIIGGMIKIVQLIFTQAQQLLIGPLSVQISILSDKIEILGRNMDKLFEENKLVRERVAKVESSAKSLHHRVDYVESILAIDHTEGRQK